MQILNKSYGVEFKFSNYRIITTNTGAITSIRKHYDINQDKYRVIVTYDGKKAMFYYDDVLVPSTASVDDLISTILAYNNSSTVMTKFSASVGQTIFDVQSPLKATTIVVIDSSIQTWGYTATPGGYQVIFSAGFSGGEEVVILTF